jgi:hypothetical protein
MQAVTSSDVFSSNLPSCLGPFAVPNQPFGLGALPAYSVEKVEKPGTSKIPSNSMASDSSHSAPPRIDCGGFGRIFRQTCWSPASFL